MCVAASGTGGDAGHHAAQVLESVLKFLIQVPEASLDPVQECFPRPSRVAPWLLILLGVFPLAVGPATAAVPSASSTTVESRVASSDDDAEEDASGAVARGSSDLEL